MTSNSTSAHKKQLLKTWFHGRTSAFALQMPGRKAPGPIYYSGEDVLDQALASHVDGVEATFDNWHKRKNPTRAVWRLGGYTVDEEAYVCNLCIDLDAGVNHAESIKDVEVVLLWLYTWTQGKGFCPYIEKSGGGASWHVWFFFKPKITAIKAKKFGKWIVNQIPHDLLLLEKPYTRPNGDVVIHARPEVFPKQTKASKTGNMVYNPWWHGAPKGACEFYDADLNMLTITDFKTTDIPTAVTMAQEIEGRSSAPRVEYNEQDYRNNERNKEAFCYWKAEMEAEVPIEQVYGPWLTGVDKGNGFVEARDPDSPTGDRHPSAGVYTARDGMHSRGFFNSFRSGPGLGKDIIQFMMDVGQATDFKDACRQLAIMSGTEELCPFTRMDGSARPVPKKNRVAIAKSRTKDKKPAEIKAKDLLPPGINELTIGGPVPRICVTNVGDDSILRRAVKMLLSRNMIFFQLFRKKEGKFTRVLAWNNGSLVDIFHDRAGETLMGLLLMNNIEWIRISVSGEEVADHPPYKMAFKILATMTPSLPEIKYIVERPCFMPDGALVLKQGYNKKNLLYNEGDFSHYDIPKSPTNADVRRALGNYNAIIRDFPLKHQRDRNFYLAALVQQFVRLMITSPTPLYVFTATGPGAGKTLLARIAQAIVGGKEGKITAASRDNEAELDKQITAVMIGNPDSVLMDNIKDTLDSPRLEDALTSKGIQGRLLGRSEMLDLTNMALWLMTSNRATLSSDMARRSVRIELTSEKTDYAIKNLDKFVEHNKEQLQISILTIIQRWISDGALTPRNQPLLRSYESWCEIMAGIMNTLKRYTFAQDLQDVILAHDPIAEQMAMIIPSWVASYGEAAVQSRQIYQILESKDIINDLKHGSSLNRFSKWLRRIADQSEATGYVLDATMNNSGRWEYTLTNKGATKEISSGKSIIDVAAIKEHNVSLIHDDIKGMDQRLLDNLASNYNDPFFEEKD